MLTIGSLFAGVGGLELGLERAGLGPVRWQVEVDPKCTRVLAHHWPDAERFGDIRLVDAARLARVDVLCGGPPCQDISVAGRSAGIDGARSGLWREYVRIARALRPRYCVLENVAALAARGLALILEELAACGYDALWLPLRASDVGAPHARERLFVVAWHVSDPERDPVRLWAERMQREGRGVRASQRIDDELVDLCPPGHVAWPPAPFDAAGWDAWRVRGGAEPGIRRELDGLSGRLDRLRMLGNAVCPQVAEVVGQVIVQLERARVDALEAAE